MGRQLFRVLYYREAFRAEELRLGTRVQDPNRLYLGNCIAVGVHLVEIVPLESSSSCGVSIIQTLLELGIQEVVDSV